MREQGEEDKTKYGNGRSVTSSGKTSSNFLTIRGQVVINLLANVKQKTIEPLIKEAIVPGTRVYTDEYSIYARMQTWGIRCHSCTGREGLTPSWQLSYKLDNL